MRLAIVASAIALRAGLRAILKPGSPSLGRDLPEVIFEASSLNEFTALAPPVDVLLISVETVSRADLQQVLPEEPGRLAVLVISDHQQTARQLAGLPLHGWGVLPVETSAEELQAAVRAVYEGLIVGAPALLEPVMAQMQVASSARARAGTGHANRAREPGAPTAGTRAAQQADCSAAWHQRAHCKISRFFDIRKIAGDQSHGSSAQRHPAGHDFPLIKINFRLFQMTGARHLRSALPWIGRLYKAGRPVMALSLSPA